MTDRELALGPEWSVLEMLCTGRVDREPEAVAQRLRTEGMQWGTLIEHALRHQMLPMLALHVLRSKEQFDVPVPGRIAHYLLEALEVNRWNMQVFRREAVRVSQALTERGVRFVVTKGMTLESTIYRGEGVRTMKDIDFMITPEGRETVSSLLGDLGYQPGVYDRATGGIVPHPRKQHMTYLLNPDHLPRHARLCEEPCVPYLYVDFANSLTWFKSEYEVPLSEALSEVRDVALPGVDAAIPAFSHEYNLLFTVLHLFREAWLEQWVELELDVSLMKFADVIRLCEEHRDLLESGRFAALLDRHGVTQPVAWVFEHNDRAFGTDLVERAGLGGAIDEEWLAKAHPSDAGERRWRGTMRERLWAIDRAALFERLGEN